MAGEDASGAAGVAVVRVRQRQPELKPKMNPYSPIRIRHRLLRASQQSKGSQS
jgi:hypothetical protein